MIESTLPPDAVVETLPSGAPVPAPVEPPPAPALVVAHEPPAVEPPPVEPTPESEAAPTPDATDAVADEPVAADEAPPAEEAPPPAEPAPEPVPENKKRWYVVKVQSGREDTIREAIERKVKIEGVQEFYGQIVVPTETTVEMRDGKRMTRKTKKFPGYLMAEVEYNDRILYLFRETSGVGDFVGGSITRAPQPMTQGEVDRMLGVNSPTPEPDKIKVKRPKYERGDRLRVRSGTFAGMEGEVLEILEDKTQVKLQVSIFGRPVDLELEYGLVEPV